MGICVNFCFLNSHNVRLVKIKEGQQFRFFAFNAIGVYANKLQSTDKLFLLVPNEEDPVFFSFVRGSNLFWLSKFNWSSKKESEKLKNSHFEQIQIHFVFCKVSYWDSVMKEHPLWTCHSELPCDLSELHRCIIHCRLCSLCNTKIHFLIPVLTVHCLHVWRMMRESAFHSPRIRRPYLMGFVEYRHVTWGWPCLQVDHSPLSDFLTKPEAMIHNEKTYYCPIQSKQQQQFILILKQSTDNSSLGLINALLSLNKFRCPTTHRIFRHWVV